MPNLIKIEFPDAAEIVSVKFDNALELADKDALVYGGAVRDMIAGLPLEGDLDIVSSYESYLITIENFRMSGKWVEESETGLFNKMSQFMTPGYKRNENIGKIVTFKTFGNTRVQLMQARKKNTKDILEANLRIVKSVDIICCGLIMDVNGDVFEVLDNAHNDCLNRILRLNRFNRALNIESLQRRIEKLSKRGWKSRINIEKVKKMANEIEKLKPEEPKGGLYFDIDDYIRYSYHPIPFRSKVVIDRPLVKLLGGRSAAREIAIEAARSVKIKCSTAPSYPKAPNLSVYIETAKCLKKMKTALSYEIGRNIARKESRKTYTFAQPGPELRTSVKLRGGEISHGRPVYDEAGAFKDDTFKAEVSVKVSESPAAEHDRLIRNAGVSAKVSALSSGKSEQVIRKHLEAGIESPKQYERLESEERNAMKKDKLMSTYEASWSTSNKLE